MVEVVKGDFIKKVKDLEVYKRAYNVSLEVHKSSLDFPKIEQYALADQIRRASKSVCANLAEGFAKQSQSKAEFRRFLSMAIGSAGEMQVWLDYCRDLDYIDEQTWLKWEDDFDAVSRMLYRLRNSGN
jgi:four helix bundle protein